MSQVTRRTTKLAVGAFLAALILTGCAGLRPGVAAQVGDAKITTRELDEFASSFCAFTAENGQPLSSAEARVNSLTVLLRGQLASELQKQYRADIDRGLVETQLEGVSRSITSLPSDQRKTFLEHVRRAIEGNLVVEQAAVAQVRATGEEPTQENVGAAVEKVYADWAESEGVEIDPRFGTVQNVVVTASSGSLSVPTGSEADATLPGSKTCG